MPAPTPETEAGFQAAVIQLARTLGWRCHHQRAARTSHGWRSAIQGDKGWPDVVLAKGPRGTHPGRLLIVELKSERGVLTEDQLAWKAVLESVMGIEYYLWKPSNWSAIVQVLCAH